MRQRDLQHSIHRNSPVFFLLRHEPKRSAHFPTPSSQRGISSHLPFFSLPLLAEVYTRSRKTSTTTCGAASGSGPQTGYNVCQHTSLNLKFSPLSFAKPVLPSWMHMFLFSYVWAHRSNDDSETFGRRSYFCPAPTSIQFATAPALQHLMVLWYSVKKNSAVFYHGYGITAERLCMIRWGRSFPIK